MPTVYRVAKARTPIYATASESLRRSDRGFTLLELLVALAIAGLAVALVPPALERLGESMRYRDALRAVVSDLRMARQKAATDGRDVRFSVNLRDRNFGIDGASMRPLAPSVQLRVTVAGQEWSEQQKGAIRFLGSGGATGGSVDVLRRDGSGVRIGVDWLSGNLTQTPLTP